MGMYSKSAEKGRKTSILAENDFLHRKSGTMLSKAGERRDSMKDPQKELVRLGLSPNRKGYWDLLEALSLVAQNRSALTAITKEIYEPTAGRRNVEWCCVETSMRKALASIWKNGNRRMLQHVMHRTLLAPPTVGDFLGAFESYLSDEPVKIISEGTEKVKEK